MRKREKQTPADSARLLFALHEQQMYRIAYAILRDQGRAEDAVMDAFEKILRRPRSIDPRSEEARKLLLYTVRSTAIDSYRKQAREDKAVAFPGDEPLSRLGAVDDSYGATGALELMEHLPGDYREVLRERIVEHRSVSETAEDLGISQANVRKRQQRAIKMLRRQMGVADG